MTPFDLDVRDADYRRDPERPRANTADPEPQPVRLVGAEREHALSTLAPITPWSDDANG